MKHSLALGTTLFGVWLLWSGHYTPLLIGCGLVSCLLVVLLSRRMEILDEETAPVHLGLRPFIYYAPWLVKEIVLANIDVAWRILQPRMPIQPTIVRVKASQQGEIGRVIFANSITLTPGTVSIDMEGDIITVHALTREAAEFEESGEMDRRVTKLEVPD
ncbi:MAG: sodium:proton antiporter [Planctomycetales bacterium]|nr:sodium:proton antiporter [Planctomycetales bacterium]NIM09767.1 sodium:proton antiporter [Planctomycetales bacterium]NIN09236.1 sodium:proton antiporter [Planctomycetales bacterium]NIN78336.1 sodium:proton antiporter [Planctomycetales bacterium]NIO35515.1 sodium:proton antiporter [Planctomycetales bacterium]